jgi:SAM-dependent MidA family methyltransferase
MLFGEMIAVWIVCFLKKIKIWDEETRKVLQRFRIVELGGGRGSLMEDIIRSFNSWQITNNFDISFVEMSEYNRKAQQDAVL